MKTIALSTIIGAMLAAGLVQSRAAASTNVILAVNISLSGLVKTGENTAERARITTGDVISAIGTATTNTFSNKAKLLAVFPPNVPDPHFIVRDGTNDFTVPTRVARVLSVASVDVAKTNTSGAISGTSALILRFIFVGAGGHPSFDVQGYTTASVSSRGSGHDLLSDNA